MRLKFLKIAVLAVMVVALAGTAASNTVTLAPLKDGIYSLVHLDWDTGQEVGRVILGKSPFFYTGGGSIIPLNEDETYITGVFGPVRISKRK